MSPIVPGDSVPVAERFRITQWLRLVTIGLVLVGEVLAPESLGPDRAELVPWTLALCVVALAAEGLSMLLPTRMVLFFGGMLMVDSVWLAWGAHLTGGTTSPLRYVMLLHLGAAALLASRGTGIKLALWYSLLLVMLHDAVSRGVIPETAPGTLTGTASPDQRLAIFIVMLWLVAISTSTLSAINERELRRRRGDLEALTNLAEQIERTDDSPSVARTLLDAAVSTFGFSRGVVLASAEGQLPLLASFGLDEETARRPGRPGPSSVVAKAHDQKGTVLVHGLNVETEPWLACLLPGALRLVVVPLSAEGRSLGALVVEHGGRSRIEPRVVSALERSASYAALALRNAWLLEQVRRLAATDGLTKIANRRTFEATLEREIARATRSAEHLSLVMVDIDHFKALNDSHGHQAGDEVLRNVAAALSCECRDFDTPARYGGEEFAVILPGCGPDEAYEIAERLRLSVSAAPASVPITASAGVATYPSHAGDADTLVRAADEALYASKHAGRDRTTVSMGVPPEAQVDALLRRAVIQRLGKAMSTESEDALAPSPRRVDN
ncbi:MAG: diguanylate cyclase [Frankiales bacterium]|nr:diguanylate cyclase [Frankiales bacterium]